MNEILKAILLTLLNKKCFGGKHTPEKRLINSKLKWANKEEKKEFERGYRELVNEGIILRSKKMTGKSSDWHVCLNPKRLKELSEKLGL